MAQPQGSTKTTNQALTIPKHPSPPFITNPTWKIAAKKYPKKARVWLSASWTKKESQQADIIMGPPLAAFYQTLRTPQVKLPLPSPSRTPNQLVRPPSPPQPRHPYWMPATQMAQFPRYNQSIRRVARRWLPKSIRMSCSFSKCWRHRGKGNRVLRKLGNRSSSIHSSMSKKVMTTRLTLMWTVHGLRDSTEAKKVRIWVEERRLVSIQPRREAAPGVRVTIARVKLRSRVRSWSIRLVRDHRYMTK